MQKLIKLTLITILALNMSAYAKLNWMPSNYWYSGLMHIASTNPDLVYKMHVWDDKSKSYTESPIPLVTNKTFSIRDLMGSNDKAPHLFDGAKIVFAPSIPYISTENPDDKQKIKQQYDDVAAGKLAAFFVVTRKGGIINFYIIGPTLFAQFAARKLSFNFIDFEKAWVQSTWWYRHLSDHAAGMSIAASFDATFGDFLQNAPPELNNQFLFIHGLNHNDSKIVSHLGGNWFGLKNEPHKSKDSNGLTIDLLKAKGIIVHQNGLDFSEFKEITGIINESKSGNF